MKPGQVGIVGVASSPIRSKLEDLEHELAVDVIAAALEDAGLGIGDVDGFVFASPYQQYCKQLYFPTFILNHLRVSQSVPLIETMGNGMTAESAFRAAVDQIVLGRGEVIVAVGVSKWSMASPAEHFDVTMRAVADVDYEVQAGPMPLSWYAMDAQRYLHRYGVDREQFAAVSVKNRNHAKLNPIAQIQKDLTIEQVIESRPIVEPLHLLDICPRSDGACAIVVAAEGVLGARGVPLLSDGFYHDGSMSFDDGSRDETTELVAAKRASTEAYQRAGITVDDIDFAEVYAPATSVEVMVTEALGFFENGEGAAAAAAGATSLGGQKPVSTSGGLLSRGHPPRVTPLLSLLEAVVQLRHEAGARQVEGASIGLTTGEMGRYNGCSVHVFGSPGRA